MSEKLILASLVEGSAHFPVYGLVQAWDVDSLAQNLRQQRYRMEQQFLPVAAFVADPAVFLRRFKLMGFPQSLWLANFASVFGKAVIEPQFQRPIFTHYGLMDDATILSAVWELATGLRDVG